MQNLGLITIVLLIILIGLLVALALKLRRWVWDIHQDTTNLRNEFRRHHREVNEKIIATINEAKMEAINAACLTPLSFNFPVFLGNWSIDSFLARYLIQYILEYHPRCILELGCGSSTIIISRTLLLLKENDVTHIAVDHEEKYLNLTRNLAKLNHVDSRIEFIHCPLIRYDELNLLWYQDIKDILTNKQIKVDLLLVDGPPGFIQKHSRYPALPMLKPFLSQHSIVILDDAIRSDEQEIAKEWENSYPEFKLEFILDGHGVAILKHR